MDQNFKNYHNDRFSNSIIWKDASKEYKRQLLANKIDLINSNVIQFFSDENLSQYEMKYREGQVNMSMDIVEAIRDEQHLIIEAGVGIGKTFAYLVPIIHLKQIIKRQLIVATSTIALQEQLEDDAEILQKMLGTKINVTVAKGQNNYLCKDKLEYLENISEETVYRTIEYESKQGQYGVYDRSKFSIKIEDDVWDIIKIQKFNQRYCGSKCKHFTSCYYYNQRRILQEEADIVICNQDLLTAHFLHGKKIFNYNIGLIAVDEAHNLESKVRNALTQKITSKEILQNIYESRKSLPKGISIDYEMQRVEKKSDQLFDKIHYDCIKQDRKNKQEGEIDRYDIFRKTGWQNLIKDLSLNLGVINDKVSLSLDYEKRHMRDSIAKASEAINKYADLFHRLNTVPDDFVYWAEKTKSGSISLFVCPRKNGISNWINENYFPNEGHRTILTSATLRNSSIGEPSEQYSYLADIIGFPKNNKGYICEAQESPFNYNDNAIIYIAEGLPHPSLQHENFIEQGTEKIIELLELTNGRSLILFTAKFDLNEVYNNLKDSNLPFRILKEGGGRSHTHVVREFKTDVNSILLGTGSYWEGIDVEGDALSNLIIFRLPFPVPDPIINDKCAHSQDKLNEILVPEMIIKLKQGIGRLIRSENDKGIVSIIDSRLSENSKAAYKNTVFSSLPIQNITSDIKVVSSFLNRITSTK